MNEVWEIAAAILSGLAVCIPLTIKLVCVTREAVRRNSWDKLVGMISGYMVEAESKMKDGATRKEWVIGMIRVSAEKLDFEITNSDWQKISAMIDELASMAKTVNNQMIEEAKDGSNE